MEWFKDYTILVVIILLCVTGVLIKKFHSYFFREGTKMTFFRTRSDFTISTEGVRKVVLDNGMTLLIFKNENVPKVLVQIAYNIGSYVERAGERGLAHLIEHMIFKGTEKLAETDIDAIARKFGASFNAFTSMDVTSYYFETNKSNWRPFIGILADCMQNARFEEQHLASELKAVIQELKMYKDNYWSMMFEKIVSLLFPANHPYHYPVIGYKEDLLNLSAKNLKRFYKKYYTPDRATLFVVGDVDDNEVINLVKEHFEAVKISDQQVEIPSFPHLSKDLVAQSTRFYEDVASEQLGFYWRIPGLKDEDEIVSTAAAFLLGNGEGSRLHRALVDEHQVANSVGVYAQKFMEAGVFVILIEPVAGKAEACKKIVRDELEKAVEKGFSAKEFEHMTKSQGKRFFEKLQFFTKFTYEWLSSYFATDDEYAIFDRVNQFVDIESSQIQAFIDEHLDTFFMNQIEVLPLPESKKDLGKKLKEESAALDRKIMETYVRTQPVEEPKFVYELSVDPHLDFTFPKPDRLITLKNGLKVLLRQNRTLPLISLNCKFNEFFYFSAAKEGVPVSLMMDMLLEATDGYTKKENVDFFEFHGVSYYFGSGGGRLSLLADNYKKIFERFVQILLHPTFSKDAFVKLKNIMIDSFMRSKDEPSEVGIRQLKSIIYSKHPFDWSFDEAIELVKNLLLDDLRKLHTGYVVPSNMTLSVVGDFDLDEMEQALEAVFGIWSKGTAPQIDYPKNQFEPGKKVDVPMVRDQVVLLFGQPSTLTIYDPDLIPIKLLNYIVFYSLGSRLFQLRERTGVFYTAFGSWASNASRDIGFDYMGAILSNDKLDFAQEQMRVMIENIAENGVTEQELAAARQLYVKSLIDSVSNNTAVADLLGTIQVFDLGFDYYDKVLKRIQDMSVDELNILCKKYFDMSKMARVRVGRINE